MLTAGQQVSSAAAQAVSQKEHDMYTVKYSDNGIGFDFPPTRRADEADATAWELAYYWRHQQVVVWYNGQAQYVLRTNEKTGVTLEFNSNYVFSA
jgi:nucleoside 2-deoxyribosyltransferase